MTVIGPFDDFVVSRRRIIIASTATFVDQTPLTGTRLVNAAWGDPSGFFPDPLPLRPGNVGDITYVNIFTDNNVAATATGYTTYGNNASIRTPATYSRRFFRIRQAGDTQFGLATNYGAGAGFAELVQLYGAAASDLVDDTVYTGYTATDVAGSVTVTPGAGQSLVLIVVWHNTVTSDGSVVCTDSFCVAFSSGNLSNGFYFATFYALVSSTTTFNFSCQAGRLLGVFTHSYVNASSPFLIRAAVNPSTVYGGGSANVDMQNITVTGGASVQAGNIVFNLPVMPSSFFVEFDFSVTWTDVADGNAGTGGPRSASVVHAYAVSPFSTTTTATRVATAGRNTQVRVTGTVNAPGVVSTLTCSVNAGIGGSPTVHCTGTLVVRAKQSGRQ